MVNILLFGATVVIWGTTWFAIKMQVAEAPALVSVFHRFAIAALVMPAALALGGRWTWPSRRDQLFILAQALCLFSLNFVCFYLAAADLTSGLEAVVFSLATLFNAMNARLFFKERVAGRTLLAAALGLSGLALLFSRDLFALDGGALRGLGLALLGTMLFSLGNMVSRRNSAAGVTPATANAFGMAYGAATLLALVLMSGTPLVAPPLGPYWAAALYLGVIGSVVGFTAYLQLVARIGASKAAYATALFPFVALALSTLLEDYSWDWRAALGLALTLAGNIVIFSRGAGPLPAIGQSARIWRPMAKADSED